ncbi:ergothioneine biosynthesis protein EgtB [Xanthomonas sp. A2111]|uniref:Ergothioneine biosynthesis protein EgtB n=1 Tax=Xanthomonas hawaiiensis TaxID=3003247 RepID=A0ABU2I806_9XANT|nr:ergothioneine biosynthesis protein EgtB [Xanthomonas sp. A2111]MBO9827637.1 ergothioneine biosynthesis protein EgtB [Xanthomonas sp. A2111]MDS9994273.1 ergothioneine biosynthesis protein EgtB [Xanthomonas sp. A2111]
MQAISPASPPSPIASAATLAERLRRVRARSRHLAAPLSEEDAMVQSMDDASPAKWHLAHTTWFFERFVLGADPAYRARDPQWDYLFNSYYQSIGPAHARPHRGLLSRPSLAQVLDYRSEIESRVLAQLQAGTLEPQTLQILELGLQHEQQHQELLLTDIKHAFWRNPLGPAYRADLATRHASASPLRWLQRDEQIGEIGAAPWPAHTGFAYDNESPRHRVLVPAHALASRPVSNAEYADFIADGGYRTVGLWLSDGWARRCAEDWQRPLYWHADGAREFTLGGWRERDPHAPACHLSLFEADAFARWAGARLPTEAEWEQAATGVAMAGNFVETDALHPQSAAPTDTGLQQLFGDVWEWTGSAYLPYPGFRPWSGTLGEYNGKFMNAQWVLRGGSCATPHDHIRASYRNFFPSDARWQFAGVRLAKDSA